MKPVLIINESVPDTKRRLVVVNKQSVFTDVELHSYKHAEGNIQDVKIGNAMAADNSEDMDGAIIARNVEFRDSELRKLIRAYLADETKCGAGDQLNLEDAEYKYFLALSVQFNDALLKPLAEYFHRYLVWGALYDWYSQFNLNISDRYKKGLEAAESGILDLVAGTSIVKRPMQPFGPAQKIY